MRVIRLDTAKRWQDQDLGGLRLNKSCCITRYGAIGDMLMMSSVLPGLKKQGYNITINTTPKGYNIIKNDPYIDVVFLQETGQVPNQELGDYWEKLSKCFFKYINLSESVEGSLLSLPSRLTHFYSQELRHYLMNRNYMECTHAVAGVDYPPYNIRFYPTENEKKWARMTRLKMGGEKTFVILWSLAGSCFHKVWPYFDSVIARILVKHKKVKIVLTGDFFCKILEIGWEKEPRVLRRSGKWKIRQTLAFVEQADLVIGPETGLMVSASMLSIPKILFLSHSSKENIGKEWINTIILEPQNVPCYPCHKLHYGYGHCRRIKINGTDGEAALCQANISVEMVDNAIDEVINEITN